MDFKIWEAQDMLSVTIFLLPEDLHVELSDIL